MPVHPTSSTSDDLPIAPPHGDAPVCVGYSGGMDSSVLLHRLATIPALRTRGLRALHVHHGLHPDADAWADHCAAVCSALGVTLDTVRVQVPTDRGVGREAAARGARHAAFADALTDGEILALAHHRDDQAETLLLRALRGSGVDGLAAMRAWRAYGRGWLWRPLLDQPRDALHAHAMRHALRWIDDPSNADDALDRNFLRNRVLPLLRERWPHADASFARSAALTAHASDLLGAEDAVALASTRTDDPQVLRVQRLSELPSERRARALRRWIGELSLPPLPAQGVARIESDLLAARPDATARFAWHGALVRRWRGLLHAGHAAVALPTDFSVGWDGCTPLHLPTGDRLMLVTVDDAGSSSEAARDVVSVMPRNADASEAVDVREPATRCAFDTPLTVHARRGGERIVLPGRDHSHALKQLQQQLGVPPWQRERLPLLSDAAGTLLGAGDAIVSATLQRWLHARGLRLHWLQNPLP